MKPIKSSTRNILPVYFAHSPTYDRLLGIAKTSKEALFLARKLLAGKGRWPIKAIQKEGYFFIETTQVDKKDRK